MYLIAFCPMLFPVPFIQAVLILYKPTVPPTVRSDGFAHHKLCFRTNSICKPQGFIS